MHLLQERFCDILLEKIDSQRIFHGGWREFAGRYVAGIELHGAVRFVGRRWMCPDSGDACNVQDYDYPDAHACGNIEYICLSEGSSGVRIGRNCCSESYSPRWCGNDYWLISAMFSGAE